MNRFQKKCFIISTALHLLLAVMVIVGSAFLSAGNNVDNSPILDFVSPDMIPTDGKVAGGGGPMMRPPSQQPQVPEQPVQPPAAPPQVQQPVVQPQSTPPKPQPRTEVVKPPEPQRINKSPDAIEIPKPTKRPIVVNTDVVSGSSKDKQKAKDAQLAADKAAKEAADKQKRLAALFDHATSSIKTGASSGTDIKFNAGFGTPGPAYASWLSIIKTIYYNDWKERATDGLTDDSAKAEATVVIARNGTVISAELTKSSGNSAVDRSIQSTLNHVKFTSRFPETSKEDQTQLILEFSVKALKQLMG
jgi:TonB family protein